MDDSRNQPELETLGYKPVNANRECVTKITGEEKPHNPEPASAQPTTLGFNSAVIKPETRVNKSESAEQRFKALCKTNIGTKDKPDYRATQPNKNLMIISEIEGLMSQVNDKIHSLSYNRLSQDRNLKSQALEEIDLFQKTTLYELRKAFE